MGCSLVPGEGQPCLLRVRQIFLHLFRIEHSKIKTREGTHQKQAFCLMGVLMLGRFCWSSTQKWLKDDLKTHQRKTKQTQKHGQIKSSQYFLCIPEGISWDGTHQEQAAVPSTTQIVFVFFQKNFVKGVSSGVLLLWGPSPLVKWKFNH